MKSLKFSAVNTGIWHLYALMECFTPINAPVLVFERQIPVAVSAFWMILE